MRPILSILVGVSLLGCQTSPGLLHEAPSGAIWLSHVDGSDAKPKSPNNPNKPVPIAMGFNPQWIPGEKTHFAYLDGPLNPQGSGPEEYTLVVGAVNAPMREDLSVRASALGEDDDSFSWSPDRSAIVYRTHNREISRVGVDFDPSTPVPAPVRLGPGTLPRWSPAGDKIAYQSLPAGPSAPYQIWIMDADGKNPYLLSKGYRENSVPVWSPNGRQIAHTCIDANYAGICVTDVSPNNATAQTSRPIAGGSMPRIEAPGPPILWDPDGKLLFYSKWDKQQSARMIIRLDLQSKAEKAIASGVGKGCWAINNQHLYYANSSTRLQRVDYRTGKITSLNRIGLRPDVW